ncbi:Eco57I restriction-modification methylase domain-containing protein [Candidatus Binatia bacterium]|nr:Eco57I restriction-modification methylase domain-containing protein [Candidatus Binatia bacterium]
MKAFVPTPMETVDLMVDRLFRDVDVRPEHTVLDPGSGTGAFIEGIIRWCERRGLAVPHVVGVESDARLLAEARRRLKRHRSVELRENDFLACDAGLYDFVVGNPPYVAITGLSVTERSRYRQRYETARGRFDLYLLFFEQALMCLKPGGRLVFITPEKFLYVETAAPLRRILARRQLEEIRLVGENTFGTLLTYPAVTSVRNAASRGPTVLIGRTGETVSVTPSSDGSSWLPQMNGSSSSKSGATLNQICVRVSCGVATGADAVFVLRDDLIDPQLKPFAYPTVAGRELTLAGAEVHGRHAMLVPYTRNGQLLKESELGGLHAYLMNPGRRAKLTARTCVARKPWYAFHETPPLPVILRPKILCKDITAQPGFWLDRTGGIVPRHSVYYIVPKNPDSLEEICQYLNSELARRWLASNCQRAANGFLRVQSHVLKLLPIPHRLATIANRRTGDPAAANTGKQLGLPLRVLDADAV